MHWTLNLLLSTILIAISMRCAKAQFPGFNLKDPIIKINAQNMQMTDNREGKWLYIELCSF
jgi:hypothetical protein